MSIKNILNISMNQQALKPFLPTINALESFIRELEVNLGVEHKPSPFDQLVPSGTHTQKIEAQTQVKADQKSEPVQLVQEEKKETEPPKKQQEKKGADNQEKKVKEEKPKQEKQPKQSQAKAAPAPQVDLGEFADLAAVDIRVGQLVDCWIHPESDKLYCEKIDVGFEVREIASGLQKFVPLDQMKGQVLVLTNLKGKKLAGFMSNGMVLCASNADHTQVEILRPAPGSKVGERVKVQGHESLFSDDVQAVLNPKKKQWENTQPKLLTNNDLEATFAGQLLVTSAGTIKSQTLGGSSIS